MLSNAKNTEKEALSRHKSESSSSDSFERSDDNNEDDYRTGAKDNNCYGAGAGDSAGADDSGGDRKSGYA